MRKRDAPSNRAASSTVMGIFEVRDQRPDRDGDRDRAVGEHAPIAVRPAQLDEHVVDRADDDHRREHRDRQHEAHHEVLSLEFETADRVGHQRGDDGDVERGDRGDDEAVQDGVQNAFFDRDPVMLPRGIFGEGPVGLVAEDLARRLDGCEERPDEGEERDAEEEGDDDIEDGPGTLQFALFHTSLLVVADKARAEDLDEDERDDGHEQERHHDDH